MLTGRRALTRIRATESGEVIELDREQLLGLIQTDAELSDIFMRAFILRRIELIASGYGDVVLIGSIHCAGTLRVKEFLTRNGHPFHYIDLDRDTDAQDLLDRFHVSAADVPVLVCHGDAVLRNPSNLQVADCLGFNEAIDRIHVRDLVIVGAGPAGLAAAVYGASEGLDVLVLELKLSRVSHRHFRSGPHGTRVRAGPEVRGAGDDREGGIEAYVRATLVLRAPRRWRANRCPRADHRVGGPVP
jgi:thioredoxin reductase (NADPH)